MTNLTNIAVMVLWLTNSVSLHHPNGQDKWVTNTTYRIVIVPSLNSTNSTPVYTNVTRFSWREVPLRDPRRPMQIKDGPPNPPGATNSLSP